MPKIESPPNGSPPTEVTVAEAGRIIGIGPRSVARAIRDGRLNYTRKLPGRTGAYLLDLNEVRKYAELNRKAAGGPSKNQPAPAHTNALQGAGA